MGKLTPRPRAQHRTSPERERIGPAAGGFLFSAHAFSFRILARCPLLRPPRGRSSRLTVTHRPRKLAGGRTRRPEQCRSNTHAGTPGIA